MFDTKRILKHGEPAEATVLSVDKRSHITSNELRDYDHVLEVRPDVQPPFQAKVREKSWITGLRPKAGDVLKVRSDPKTREVVFDPAGDPRYDLAAKQAETEALRQRIAANPITPASRAGAAATGPPAGPLDRLDHLVRRRDTGALTSEEFEEQRARILETS